VKRSRPRRARVALVSAVLVALFGAGGASAYALKRTIWVNPGHCRKVHGVKVCARKVKPKTVFGSHTTTVNHTDTVTQTRTVTQTVYPSPIGKTFSGNGDATLAPMTLTGGDEITWTAQPDSLDDDFFSVISSSGDSSVVEFDNGDSTTSGSTYIPAGSYTFQVSADGAWTISF
jgi:hypothetical protein